MRDSGLWVVAFVKRLFGDRGWCNYGLYRYTYVYIYIYMYICYVHIQNFCLSIYVHIHAQ